jgi:hypothetical protein
MNIVLDCWEKIDCCKWVVVYRWMIIATKDPISAIVYCSCWSHRLRKKIDFGMHFFFVDSHKIDFGKHFVFVDWHKIDFSNHLFSFIKQLFSVDLLALYSRQKGKDDKSICIPLHLDLEYCSQKSKFNCNFCKNSWPFCYAFVLFLIFASQKIIL